MKFFVTLFFIIWSALLWSQVPSSLGFLPAIEISKKIDKHFELSFIGEKRLEIQTYHGKEIEAIHLSPLDLSLVLSYRFDPQLKAGISYLLRFRQGKLYHRTIQQVTIAQALHIGQLGHRLGTDQTFTKNEQTVFRLRYRIGYKYPLTWNSPNRMGLYFKFNNEVLGLFESAETDIEFRTAPYLGVGVNSLFDVAIGLNMRFKDVISTYNIEYWIEAKLYLTL